MGKLDVLTEYQEQCLLVEYLEIKGYKFSKIAQETFTKSWAVKMRNKMSGLRRGVPDMIVILPTKYGNQLLFIEMKRLTGGRTSPEQIEWIKELNQVPGVTAVEAHGYEQARKIIESLLIN